MAIKHQSINYILRSVIVLFGVLSAHSAPKDVTLTLRTIQSVEIAWYQLSSANVACVVPNHQYHKAQCVDAGEGQHSVVMDRANEYTIIEGWKHASGEFELFGEYGPYKLYFSFLPQVSNQNEQTDLRRHDRNSQTNSSTGNPMHSRFVHV